MNKPIHLTIVTVLFAMLGLLALSVGAASAHITARPSALTLPLSNTNAYGGADRNLITGAETWPNVAQAGSSIRVKGNTILVGYTDSRGSNEKPENLTGISASTDGGATWDRFTIGSQSPFTGSFGSPIMLNTVSQGAAPTDTFIYWHKGYRCPDEMEQWAITMETPPQFYFLGCGGPIAAQPMGATVDFSPSSPFSGNVYFSGPSAAQGIVAAYTSDNGASWSNLITVTTAPRRNTSMTSGPDGTVYLATLDEGGSGLGTRTNYLYRSTDGGVTWSAGIQMGAGFPAPGVDTDGTYATMFPGAWRYQGGGQLGVSPNGVVQYAYTRHGAGSDAGNIQYVRSTDNGSTWSSPVQINTDAGAAAQWQPSLAVASNGGMYIGWYDTRNGGQCTAGANTPCYERRGRVSLDGGMTWQADQAVSDGVSPLPAQPDPNLPAAYAGYYNFAAADGTDILETWIDGRVLINGQSQQDIVFDKISLGQGTPSATPTQANTATTTLTSTPGNGSPTPTQTGTLGSISGVIHANSITSTEVISGAYIFACLTGGGCTTTALMTDAGGRYTLSGLAAGQYHVHAFPPSDSHRLSGFVGPLTLVPGGILTNQRITLSFPLPPPPGVTLRPSTMDPSNTVPSVHDDRPFKLVVPSHCPTPDASDTVFYQILAKDGTDLWHGWLVYDMVEAPFNLSDYIPALVNRPNWNWGYLNDYATIKIGEYYPWECGNPGPGPDTIEFNIYIDPSGYVRTVQGDPIPAATVTLYRSDSLSGPFDAVPDGSGIMSSSNRENPDTTRADGYFGWDVIPGYYKVRAAHTGCYAPGNPGQPYVDSYVMTIPPPVTDLDLRLECPGMMLADVPPGHTFYTYIQWMITWGYVSGYSDGTFRPDNTATRAQFAKILANAFLWRDSIPANQQRFTDVPPSHPFWLFIERVAAHGAVGGYPCGGALSEPCDAQNRPYFRPGSSITRSQIAKVIAEASQLAEGVPPTRQTFSDVTASHPFWLVVERVASQGIIGGYPCGGPSEPCDAQNRPYFRPYNTATRGQLCKMIYLALAQP